MTTGKKKNKEICVLHTVTKRLLCHQTKQCINLLSTTTHEFYFTKIKNLTTNDSLIFLFSHQLH